MTLGGECFLVEVVAGGELADLLGDSDHLPLLCGWSSKIKLKFNNKSFAKLLKNNKMFGKRNKGSLSSVLFGLHGGWRETPRNDISAVI